MPSFGLTGVDVLNAIGPLCSAFVVLLPMELFEILFHTVCNVLQRNVIGHGCVECVCVRCVQLSWCSFLRSFLECIFMLFSLLFSQCAQCFASKVIGVDVFDAMVHCVQFWCSFKLVYKILCMYVIYL